MKTLKKLATLSAAVIMAATSAVPATFMTGFAASGGSNTITIEGVDSTNVVVDSVLQSLDIIVEQDSID